MTGTRDPRIDAIAQATAALARHDFSTRLEVSGDDEVAAISAGLNMLAEKLAADGASRRELEAALAEREAAEAGLIHAGRLAVLGQVAGGVGHEINNPATWLTLGLSIMARELAALRKGADAGPVDPAALRRRLDVLDGALRDAREGVDRIRVIATDLRTFARADDVIETVSLSEVVESSVRLATATLDTRAKVTLDLRPTPALHANPSRIAQVVTNLLLNASQALAGHDGPRTIAVTTREESGGALLVVEDSGPGVPEALQSRIFRPFFTTKSAEQGTGLGLALVRQIIDRYQGDVRVGSSSELGGARFEAWVPCVRPRSATPIGSSIPRKGRRERPRILVIDDEPAILRSMRALYLHEVDVEVAASGSEAIARLTEDPAFDVIICDVHMPGVDGVAVLEWVDVHAPALTGRVVLCSGAAPTDRVRVAIAASGWPMLEKPVMPEVLEALFVRFFPR